LLDSTFSEGICNVYNSRFTNSLVISMAPGFNLFGCHLIVAEILLCAGKVEMDLVAPTSVWLLASSYKFVDVTACKPVENGRSVGNSTDPM
jgi:hypothetical protein